MRRVFVFVIAFSLILSACSKPTVQTTPFAERDSTAFSKWEIPGYFVPEQLRVVGLGDSLTQGVGDERKKGGYFGRVTDRMNEWKGVKEVTAENLAKRGRRSDQLLDQLDEKDIRREIRQADIILMTIGGNDIMKVVKGNLFELKTGPFYKELGRFEDRLDEVLTTIRLLNDDAIIVVAGLYNPFSIVTDEVHEFEEIIDDWNETLEMRIALDDKSCFVPVTDLFDSNVNMVYHTDFFHPNAKGYDLMSERFLTSIKKCGLNEMSDGDLEM